jgi:uncharacterized membrane protein YkoI
MALSDACHSSWVQAAIDIVPVMRTKITKILAAVVVAAMSQISSEATFVSASAAEACVDDWAHAATIIKRRQMVDMARLNRLAREKYSGKIMTARLCRSNGRYFYHLVIRDRSGLAKRIKVDAERELK